MINNKIIINLLITLLFLGCTQEKWLTHLNVQESYEITYSESWELFQKANALGFVSPKEGEKDGFQENVNIIVQDLSQQPMTLEEYTELSKQQLSAELGDNSITSLEKISFSEERAMEIIYDVPKDPKSGINIDLKYRQVWFIKNNKAYLFTYTAEKDQYENYSEVAMKTIESFKWK